MYTIYCVMKDLFEADIIYPCDQGLAGRPSGGKHGFEKWVIDLIDVLEKTAMLGLENRYLSS